MEIGFILGKLVLLFLPRHSSLPSCEALERRATTAEFPPKTPTDSQAKRGIVLGLLSRRPAKDVTFWGVLARAGIPQPTERLCVIPHLSSSTICTTFPSLIPSPIPANGEALSPSGEMKSHQDKTIYIFVFFALLFFFQENY